MPSLTLGKAQDEINDFIEDSNHEEHQMAILVVMGHGNGSSFALSDGNYLKESWILDCFGRSNCKHLADKPKLIIFISCRYLPFDSSG